MSSFRRIRLLFRARLAAGPRGGFPAAAILSQALVPTLLALLVRDLLPPFAYGVFLYTLTGAVLAIPLLGELGWILRADTAEDWIATLPALPRERHVARVLHLVTVVGVLATATLVPAALLAPELDLVHRLVFVLAGLGLALFLTACLALVQAALGGRAEGLLVLFQTVLVIGVVVGLTLVVRNGLPLLARLPSPGTEHATYLWFWPPVWFAAPLSNVVGEPRIVLPALAGAFSALAVLALLPPPRPARLSRRRGMLELLLAPLRRLATRLWVHRDERAGFDLVYDALPREREVVMRTYPMIGIPLAFLILAATEAEGSGAGREDILALLFFVVGIYFPVLLTHVPASASWRASWIHRTGPVTAGALAGGAIKALFVRFVVPLYLVLILLGLSFAGGAFVLRCAVPGLLTSLLVLRGLYPVCVDREPLSIPADEVKTELDWMGVLLVLAMLLIGETVLVTRILSPVPGVLVLVGLLVAAEVRAGRQLRTRPPDLARAATAPD